MDINTILTGSFGVGKTSIFRRFIYDDFSDQYTGTIGVRVNSKSINLNEDAQPINITLWDVAGEVHQSKVPTSYFQDKQLILYVVDLFRPFTFSSIPDDIDYLKKVAPDATVKIIGNKIDLLDNQDLEKIKLQFSNPGLDGLISAKLGKGVNEIFHTFAQEFQSSVNK